MKRVITPGSLIQTVDAPFADPSTKVQCFQAVEKAQLPRPVLTAVSRTRAPAGFSAQPGTEARRP